MKGIIFQLLEEAVTRAHGVGCWERTLARAGVDGAYTSLGSYPDSDLTALAAAVSEEVRLDPATVVKWFGRQALPAHRHLPLGPRPLHARRGADRGRHRPFGQAVLIQQPTCKLRGDPFCVLTCTFQERPPIAIRGGTSHERL